MPDIRSAQIYAFYLFDVAETVNLSAIWSSSPGTRRSCTTRKRAPRQVHSLFIDVNELTDH